METTRWLVYGLLGAFFAAVVSVLTKRALDRVDHLIALCVQSGVMLITLIGLTTIFARWKEAAAAPKGALGLVVISGIAAGLSWFFGYRALQLTNVAKATPIDRLSLPIAVVLAMLFLRETPSLWNFVGIALMLGGAILIAKS
jgi:transporter family protein